VIVAGGLANVVVCLLYLTVHDLGPWLYAVRIGHGITEAMLFAALTTHAADLVPATRRAEGMALFGVSGLLPMSVSGVLGDLILRHAGYPTLFLVSAAFAAGSFALSLPLRDHPRGADDLPARGFLRAVAERDLLPLWLIGTVFAVAITAVFGFLKTFVLTTGIGTVGGFFTAYSLAAVVVRLFFGWVPDRIGLKRALFPALGSLAAGFALLAVAPDRTVVLTAGACAGLGHGFTFPSLAALVVQRARAAERGAAMSLFTALFDVGVLIGGPLFGLVIALAGYPAMFATAAGLVVAGAAVFALVDRPPATARRPLSS
jgi:predicted MFS family arabinose efflux permease